MIGVTAQDMGTDRFDFFIILKLSFSSQGREFWLSSTEVFGCLIPI